MAKQRRQRIGILFLGGSVIDGRGRRGDVVRKASDVEPWLDRMGELDIIADTDGIFIHDGKQPPGLPEWSEAAQAIGQAYRGFDGFVVVHDLATILPAGLVLSLMLENLEKPVVLVGSPLQISGLKSKKQTSEFGAKASIINAVQVATADLAEVVIIFGSSIYRGSTIIPNQTDTNLPSGTVLGKIDFGIRLQGEQRKRATRSFSVHPKFLTDVAAIEILPGLDQQSIMKQAKGHEAVFLSSTEGIPISSSLTAALERLPETLPVGVFTKSKSPSYGKNTLLLQHEWRMAALLHFLWALGQTKDIRRLRKLLKSGEIS